MNVTIHSGTWRDRDGVQRCDYCGSLSPAEALRRMTTPGCKFSGTDKGGYKFYFTSETGDHGKFYGEHLGELTRDELSAWAEVSRRVLGVDWTFRAGHAPTYSLPNVDSFYGWQTYGVIGPNGQPVHDPDAPSPPSEEWWTTHRPPHPMVTPSWTPPTSFRRKPPSLPGEGSSDGPGMQPRSTRRRFS